MVGTRARCQQLRGGEILVESPGDDGCGIKSRGSRSGGWVQRQFQAGTGADIESRQDEDAEERSSLVGCILPGPVSTLDVLADENRVGVPVAGTDEVQCHPEPVLDVVRIGRNHDRTAIDREVGQAGVRCPEHSRCVGDSGRRRRVGAQQGIVQVRVVERGRFHVTAIADVTEPAVLVEVVVVNHAREGFDVRNPAGNSRVAQRSVGDDSLQVIPVQERQQGHRPWTNPGVGDEGGWVRAGVQDRIPVVGGRQLAVGSTREVLSRCGQLLQSVGTLGPPGGGPGVHDGRHDQGCQHGDDGDHHQQFDQGKALAPRYGTGHVSCHGSGHRGKTPGLVVFEDAHRDKFSPGQPSGKKA